MPTKYKYIPFTLIFQKLLKIHYKYILNTTFYFIDVFENEPPDNSTPELQTQQIHTAGQQEKLPTTDQVKHPIATTDQVKHPIKKPIGTNEEKGYYIYHNLPTKYRSK